MMLFKKKILSSIDITFIFFPPICPFPGQKICVLNYENKSQQNQKGICSSQ